MKVKIETILRLGDTPWHCLYLDPGARIQHDVLDGALDVLCPRCQPGHLVVMANFLPFCPWGRFRVFGVSSEKDGG